MSNLRLLRQQLLCQVRNLVATERNLATTATTAPIANEEKQQHNTKGIPAQSPDNPLVDSFGRFHKYLRISLVEKCNLRCQYCMPEEGIPLCPSSQLLTAEEIVRIGRLFASNGVEKVRLTGGEPTIRKDLVEIVRELAKIEGIRQLGLTSNGVILNRLLVDLVESGLTHLNISLDTLIPSKYIEMTRRNAFDKVWKAIALAESVMPKGRLKLNCVLVRGFNDNELVPMVELTRDRHLDMRFIEFMPFSGNRFEMDKFMPYQEMLAILGRHFGEEQIVRIGEGPHETSKAFKVNGFVGQFGFISSMSEHFCGGCNRLRITADGNLKVCLHGQAEISLREPLRRSRAARVDWPSGEAEGISARRAQQTDANGRFPARRKANGSDRRMKQKRANDGGFSALISTKFAIFATFIRHFSTANSDNEDGNSLSHLDSKSGDARMVDVGRKETSPERIALAQAVVQFPEGVLAKLLQQGENPKGDIFAVSRIAGILGAKSVPQLIPLCHQIPLTSVRIKFRIDLPNDRVFVFCRAKAIQAKTGVEMEAMTGCSLAALTIYDMTKSATLGIQIGSVKLLGKKGGRKDFGQTEMDN